MERQLIATSAGRVEVALVGNPGPAVLFFPGGHCPAEVDCGWDLYARLGCRVIAFSRPGYGGTQVGPRTFSEFVPAVREVCERLRLDTLAAVVGVSFGGMQAAHVAGDATLGIHRLVLHSCAPSVLPYPDTRAEAIVGRIAFSPGFDRLMWRAVRRTIRSESGVRRMAAALSTEPNDAWWDEFSDADREAARTLFASMRSDRGFALDLRQARAAGAGERRAALSRVACPTLITGSRRDGGVRFAHAESLAATIPGAQLTELDAPCHLFWLGPSREQAASAVASFLGA